MKKILKNYYLDYELTSLMDSTIEKFKPLFQSKTDFVEHAIKSYLWLLYNKHILSEKNFSEYKNKLNKEMEALKKTEEYKKGGKTIRLILEICMKDGLRNEILPEEHKPAPMAKFFMIGKQGKWN